MIQEAGDVVRLGDVVLPEGVVSMAEEDEVIARLEIARAEVVEEVEDDEMEMVEGEEAAEPEEEA